jgi:hypothetical protein
MKINQTRNKLAGGFNGQAAYKEPAARHQHRSDVYFLARTHFEHAEASELTAAVRYYTGVHQDRLDLMSECMDDPFMYEHVIDRWRARGGPTERGF